MGANDSLSCSLAPTRALSSVLYVYASFFSLFGCFVIGPILDRDHGRRCHRALGVGPGLAPVMVPGLLLGLALLLSLSLSLSLSLCLCWFGPRS